MNNNPTLLQINVFANSGSHGKIAESIGCLVLEKGWRSIIAYGRVANLSKNELVRIGSDFDIKEHVFETRFFDNHGLASRNATRKFINQIEEIKPDIIHLHVIHGYYLNYKILFDYLSSTNIPVVWTFHDTWAYTGHCGHYGLIRCEKWKTQCDDCLLKWRDYPRSIIDRSRKNFNLKKRLFTSVSNLHIVTVSQWLKKEVKDSFFKEKDVRVIPNGVDVDLFKPIEGFRLPLFDGKFVILGVSAVWGPVKGLDDFIELAELLDDDEIIVLVGVSDAQRKRLPHNVIGVNRTESVNQLVELYNRADVTMSLSKAETFGLTIAESFACGTPAIVYDGTALPDLINEETGFVVQSGNFKDLKTAISIVKKKGKSYYSGKCRELAERDYNQRKSFSDYINLYEELLHEKNSIS
jgi:glycosyltransferase involved in cell wall biosynthesis